MYGRKPAEVNTLLYLLFESPVLIAVDLAMHSECCRFQSTKF